MWRLAGLFLLFPALSCLAQPNVNDFRSAVEDGLWGINTSWERFNGTAWVPAALPPALGDGRITIMPGHFIYMEGYELIDDVVVDGTLYVGNTSLISFPPLLSGDALIINGTLELEGGIELSSGSIVRVNGSLMRYSGSYMTGSTNLNLFFQNNSLYEHNVSEAIPLANWHINSTLILAGVFNSLPPNANQAFGNVHIEFTGGLPLSMSGQMTTINGNFEIRSNKSVRFGGATPYTINIGGNLVKSGTGAITWNVSAVSGTINIAGSLIHNSGNILNLLGSINLNIAGDYQWNGTNSFTGANITFNGTQPQNFVNTLHNAFLGTVNVTVANGSTLNLATSSIGGTNTSFTLNSGATLKVGATNPEGAIANSTTVGNLRMPVGSRTYQAGSNIVYNGLLTQYLGGGHPALTGVTTIIDNPNEVIPASSPLTLNGPVLLNNGAFNISDVSLTLGGTLNSTGGVLVANQNTSLTITDTGSTAPFGEIHVANTSVIGNLTLAGTTGRNVRLGTNLAVANNLTLANGQLELNGFVLNTKGTIVQASGTLVGSASSGLRITNEGGGTLPATLNIAGGALQNLELNRPSQTLNTSSNLTISNISLLSGTFTHTGNILIQTNGAITIGTGVLTNAVTPVTSYSVIYTGSGNVNTANEIPSLATSLANLTIEKPYPNVVTLSTNVTINGDLGITGGSLSGTNRSITLKGNFISNGRAALSGGTFTFDGATIFSGDSIPQLTDILITSGSSLQIQSIQQINVAGNFTNNGSFNPAAGTILLNGTTNQNLAGTSDINLYSLIVQKSSNNVSILTPTAIQFNLRINTATTLNAGDQLLTLVSNATRTARINPLHTSAQILGNVIVQRYIPNGNGVRAYRYLSPGSTNTFVADWQAEVPITGSFDNPSTGAGIISTNPSLFYYDESFTTNGTTLESRYRNYPASGLSEAAPLQSGRGYAVFVRSTAPVTIDTRGTVATHTRVINVTAVSSNEPDGWNLVGNPYASPILWSRVNLGAGVDNAVYIPDNTNLGGLGAGSYVNYVDGVSVPAGFGGVIGSGQAFWVHATSNSSLTFNENSKIIGSDTIGQIFRESDRILFRLEVTGASRDELVIRYSNLATDNFDGKYDALKLTKADLNFFTKSNDGRDLVINTFNELQCFQSLPLYFSNVAAGTYKLKLFDFSSLPSDVNVTLVDAWLNTRVDLITNGDYTFSVLSSQAGQLSNRFRLDISRDRTMGSEGVQEVTVCSNQTEGKILLTRTQPELQYRLFINNKEFSKWVSGTGQAIEFSIPLEVLTDGKNPYTLEMKSSCIPQAILTTGILTVTTSPLLSFTSLPINICPDKADIISIPDQLGATLYNWYADESDGAPLAITEKPAVLFNDVNNLLNLYISIVSPNGCESDRGSVTISKVSLPDLKLVREGDILKTDPPLPVFWYADDQPLNTIETTEIKVEKDALVKATLALSGCVKSVESFEQVTEDGFILFPNPFKNEVYLQFDEDTPNAHVILVSSLGTIVKTFSIKANRNELVVLPIDELPSGVYFMRIETTSRSSYKKMLRVD
ncbi:MAG: T9SS type A sorting domain-containing protein [Cyclobacteriaceae bacterium]|nr:T9SS type A sorting domain-containing protein [Cyclobacteriaceae bacterium]